MYLPLFTESDVTGSGVIWTVDVVEIPAVRARKQEKREYASQNNYKWADFAAVYIKKDVCTHMSVRRRRPNMQQTGSAATCRRFIPDTTDGEAAVRTSPLGSHCACHFFCSVPGKVSLIERVWQQASKKSLHQRTQAGGSNSLLKVYPWRSCPDVLQTRTQRFSCCSLLRCLDVIVEQFLDLDFFIQSKYAEQLFSDQFCFWLR